MKILVCVKQVPETASQLEIDPASGSVALDDRTQYGANRVDESAVEEALLMEQAVAGATVDLITVGPERARKTLLRCLGMGADNAAHIVTDRQDLTPFVTASWIWQFAKSRGYDLILTGIMAEDDMQAQVGPMLAELMEIPCATSVVLERIDRDRGVIYVEREMEAGLRDCLEMDLPALLSIQSGANIPRYPSLSNYLRAKKQEVETIDASDLDTPEPRERIVELNYPKKSRAGIMIEGNEREQASKLIETLAAKSLV